MMIESVDLEVDGGEEVLVARAPDPLASGSLRAVPAPLLGL